MNSSNKHSITPGDTIEHKYEVGCLIGSGGMGAVFEAVQMPIRRKVAIKCLHEAFAADAGVVLRFQQEAEIAGSLGHDNICEVTDVGTLENGAPYLVMPLLKGDSLAGLLNSETRLPFYRISDMVCQTLSALSSAHGAGIIHRDLKPDNIFITTLGDREDFVKLLDFGISKIMGQDSVVELTRTGTVLGTPYYMSPEQARGDRAVDHRTDIYAMGVILYQALTGARPFEGTSYNEILAKIFTDPFVLPRTLVPDIPKIVEEVILKAMNRNPAERYASALEMREALENAAEKAAFGSIDETVQADSGTGVANSSPFLQEERDVLEPSSPAPALPAPQPTASTMRFKLGLALAGLFITLSVIAAIVVFNANTTASIAPITIGPVDEQAPAPQAISHVPEVLPQMALPAVVKEAAVEAESLSKEKPAQVPSSRRIPKATHKRGNVESTSVPMKTEPPVGSVKLADPQPKENEKTSGPRRLEGRSGTHVFTDYK